MRAAGLGAVLADPGVDVVVGQRSAANVVSGLAVALVITLLLPLPPVPVEGRLHPLSLLRLVVQVALLPGAVLGAGGLAGDQARAAPLTAVLRAHLAIKSDLVLALAVNVINLIPGRSCWRSTRPAG